jgi:hypothetical protein
VVGGPVDQRRVKARLLRNIYKVRVKRQTGKLAARLRFDAARGYALSECSGNGHTGEAQGEQCPPANDVLGVQRLQFSNRVLSRNARVFERL